MTRSDMVDIVAKKAKITKKAARGAIDVFLGEVAASLIKGDKVVLSGFGTFYCKSVKKKKGRANPYSADVLYHPAHTVVRFKVGKNLKDIVKK